MDMIAGSFLSPSNDSWAILSNLREVSCLNTAVVSPSSSIALPKFLTQNTMAASEGTASISSWRSMNCPASTAGAFPLESEYSEATATAIPPTRITATAIRISLLTVFVSPLTMRLNCGAEIPILFASSFCVIWLPLHKSEIRCPGVPGNKAIVCASFVVFHIIQQNCKNVTRTLSNEQKLQLSQDYGFLYFFV